jgi:aspartate/tyrosine/aromatic aminotransferase
VVVVEEEEEEAVLVQFQHALKGKFSNSLVEGVGVVEAMLVMVELVAKLELDSIDMEEAVQEIRVVGVVGVESIRQLSKTTTREKGVGLQVLIRLVVEGEEVH